MTLSGNKNVLAALLTGLAVAVGFVFIYIPNIELFTASVFIAGYILGPAYGILVGVLSRLIFSLLNPMGMSSPPLLLAQLFSMLLVGWTGGLFRRLRVSGLPRVALFGVAGFLLTLIYTVLTTLSFLIVSVGFDRQKILSTFAIGTIFTTVHVIGNAIIFSLLVPLILKRLDSLAQQNQLQRQ
ncbi:ECF transporter S component [candidate division KSB1 bacterium]|nr:ECF transporter S component [candidate division KSB1 bacterium]